MYSATNNYEKKMRADKAKAKLNEMNSANKPKTRTNLLGQKVTVERNKYGVGTKTKTKTITKKDGSVITKRKQIVRDVDGVFPKGVAGATGYVKKEVVKQERPKGKFISEKSKQKTIGGLARLFGKRKKTNWDAKTGIDTYKTKKTAFSKPEIKKY